MCICANTHLSIFRYALLTYEFQFIVFTFSLYSSCVWKGQYECSEIGNVSSIMTTMGRCFMIQFNEPIIESPGKNISFVFSFKSFYSNHSRIGFLHLHTSSRHHFHHHHHHHHHYNHHRRSYHQER